MKNDFMSQLFRYVNESSISIVESADNFTSFLSFLGRHESSLTIANKILVYGYDKEATDVRTADDWMNSGYEISRDAAVIHTMEYSPSSGRGYSDRIMYDIRFTGKRNTVSEDRNILTTAESGTVSEALIRAAPCRIEYTDQARAGGTKCFFNPESQSIFVTKGFKGFDDINQQLLREYSHYMMDKADRADYVKAHKDLRGYTYQRAVHGMEAVASSYIILKRYNRQPPDIQNVSVRRDTDPAAIRQSLNRIDIASRNVIRMLEDRNLDKEKGVEDFSESSK